MRFNAERHQCTMGNIKSHVSLQAQLAADCQATERELSILTTTLNIEIANQTDSGTQTMCGFDNQPAILWQEYSETAISIDTVIQDTDSTARLFCAPAIVFP